MPKGKILHILNYYSPHIGGIEDVCKSIVDGTPEYERLVLCYNDVAVDTVDIVDGVEVWRASLWREVARQQVSFSFCKVLRKVLRRFQPDIVQLHLPNPLTSAFVLATLPKGVRLILHWHSDITVHRHIHWLYSPIERKMLKRADAIIATSPNYIEGSPFIRPYREKCIVVPNVVSRKKLDIPASQADLDTLRRRYGENIVLFLGRHVPYKGLDHLVKAIPMVKSPATFLICGTGPETYRLKEMAQGQQHTHFLGRIKDEDISLYMRAAKIFAFPSVTKNEAFGIALAEAMYYGTVPVTFAIPGSGVNWVNLDGQTGIEVPQHDPKAYAEAIDRLLSDKSLLQQYSVAAMKRVRENFLIEHVRDRLTSLYDRLSVGEQSVGE